MRTLFWMIAGAALAATPAAINANLANNAAIAPDTNVTVEDVNATLDMPVANVADPAAAPADPGIANRAAADEDDGNGGFPWGIIGLVGLAGLLGRKRNT